MSFAAPTRQRPGPMLPLASMIDILFLLLTFFLTGAAMREQDRQMDVTLPAAETERARAASRTQIVITVTADGGLYMGEKNYDLPGLRQTLVELARQFPNEAVIIRGDRNVQLGLIVRVMDMAYGVGLQNVSLATIKTRGDL